MDTTTQATSEATEQIVKPKAREKRNRHGLRRVMAAVKLRGLDAIDRRTAEARALIEWRNELMRDLGGDISSQRRALVEMAVRTRLYIDHVDAFLMKQPSLVTKRKRALLPIVNERQRLVDSLARLLAQLGLERVALPVKGLQQYIEEKKAIECVVTAAPIDGQNV